MRNKLLSLYEQKAHTLSSASQLCTDIIKYARIAAAATQTTNAADVTRRPVMQNALSGLIVQQRHKFYNTMRARAAKQPLMCNKQRSCCMVS